MNVACNLVFQSDLPQIYWSYVVFHVLHIINTFPSITIKEKSPYEMLYNLLPTYLNLKVFGSFGFVSTIESQGPSGKKNVFFLNIKIGLKVMFF